MQNPIKLLVMSDLHIGYVPPWFKGALASWDASFYDPNVAVAAARKIALLTAEHNIDANIVVGDLALSSSQEHLQNAMTFLNGHGRRDYFGDYELSDGHASIGLITQKTPTILVRGNHDNYQAILWPKVKRQPFSDCLIAHSTHCTTKPQITAQPFGADVVLYNFARFSIVVADFTLRAGDTTFIRPPVLGQAFGKGKVYPKILEQLHEALSHAVKPVILTCHFPPDFPAHKNIKKPKSLELLDEQLLIDALKDSEVKLIIAGHLHQQLAYTLRHTQIQVICSATSLAGKSKVNNGLHLIMLDLCQDGINAIKSTDFYCTDECVFE